MRIYRELTNIQNAIANKKAQIICPVQYTYDHITLNYTGTAVTRAMLKNIAVKANGEEIQYYKDGDRLDQINDYYSRQDTANFLTLWFNRREMKTLGDERIFGLGTADLDNLTVEIDVDATAPGDFALKADCQLSEPQPLGVFCRTKQVNFNSSVSGQVDVDKIPVQYGRLLALHAFKSDVNALDVYVDEAKIWSLTKSRGEIFEKNYGRVPQTAVATHADWILEGDTAQAIILDAPEGNSNRKKRDLLLKPTLGTSGSVDFVVEYLDTLKKAA